MDARDISDGTPLLFAAAEGLTEIIDIILDKGIHQFYIYVVMFLYFYRSY